MRIVGLIRLILASNLLRIRMDFVAFCLLNGQRIYLRPLIKRKE